MRGWGSDWKKIRTASLLAAGPGDGATGSEAGRVDRTSPLPVKPRGSKRSYRLEPLTLFRTIVTTRGPGRQGLVVDGSVNNEGVLIRPVGSHAALVEVDDARQALSLALWARAHAVPATDIVPAATTVLFDGLEGDLTSLIAGWSPTTDPASTREVVVPVVYDGADLESVADAWRVDVEEVIRRHTSREFTSAFCGFAPGFAYLAGLPTQWAVPRLDSPRDRVPAGAVALADTWCGVYPSGSPGGWRLIGRTDVALWDLTQDPPALLAPGTRVRFEVAR